MKRKNETFTQLVVGFFMVTLMALLAYFTIVVSGVDLMTGRSRIKVTVVFDQVGGLKDRDSVMYRGTKVGSVEHPMLPVHYITWIVLETNQGYQKKDLKPGEKPVAQFAVADGETVVAAYEYCNLHGLWKADA